MLLLVATGCNASVSPGKMANGGQPGDGQGTNPGSGSDAPSGPEVGGGDSFQSGDSGGTGGLSWQPAPMPAAPATAPPGPTTTAHDFNSPRFAGSDQCGFCHDGITDGAGNDVSIRHAWEPTMMANSSRDPLWQAKVAAELTRSPGLAAEINDTCSRCHAPMANEEARVAGAPRTIHGPNGLLASGNAHFPAAMDGISCTTCHQIQPTAALGTPAGASGQFVIGSERRIFGPYENPFTNPMQNHVNYTPEHAPHIQTAALCGSCHDLRTPVVDGGTGEPTGESFPEQMTWSEWKASQFPDSGETCQSCHMEAAKDVIITQRPPWFDTVRPTFRKHRFVGANAFMLDLMGRFSDLLGITATGFDTAVADARAKLQSSARLTVTAASAEGIGFDVRVENLAGHKLPSGFPSRRAWLHTVVEQGGVVVFESGAPLAGGAITGVDADADPASFEPHYAEITAPEQVAVYEGVAEDKEGAVTYTLLHSFRWKKDNRLLPKGLDKATTNDEIRPRGAAALDDDFQAGEDTVRYRLALPAGPATVRVRLLYQTMGYAFARDLYALEASTSEADGKAAITRMRWLWEQATAHYEVIAEAAQSLP